MSKRDIINNSILILNSFTDKRLNPKKYKWRSLNAVCKMINAKPGDIIIPLSMLEDKIELCFNKNGTLMVGLKNG